MESAKITTTSVKTKNKPLYLPCQLAISISKEVNFISSLGFAFFSFYK